MVIHATSPFPAVKRFVSVPNRSVNNVESIAATSDQNNGGEEYVKIGVGRSAGTKLISGIWTYASLVFMKFQLWYYCRRFYLFYEW